MVRYPLIVACLFILTACSTESTNTYKANDVGSIIETSEATVLNSRVVNIEGGDNSGAGAVAGGAVGATSGYVIAGSGSGRGLGVVLGAVLGAATGYLAEESVRSREGIEYVVRMNDGRVVTLVQNREENEEPLPNGAPVLVQYGDDYTRVIELPAGAAGAGAASDGGSGGASGWTNPDAPEGETGNSSDGDAQDATYGGEPN